MRTIMPAMVATIDRRANEVLGLSEEALIRRAGEAVADVVWEEFLQSAEEGSSAEPVIIFCGPGNNGADGYAAGIALAARGVSVTAVDVFGKGQRSEGGNAVLEEFKAKVGTPVSLSHVLSEPLEGIGIDAILGAGFVGDGMPEEGRIAVRYLNRYCTKRVAVDMPHGVDAANGCAYEEPLEADVTVVLGYMKRGLLSYPARAFCGKFILKDLGLQVEEIYRSIEYGESPDDDYVRAHLPQRPADSHKGTYGKVLLVTGSARYRGAAQLATLGALRTGVGLLTLMSEETVIASMCKKLPDVIYKAIPAMQAWDEEVLASVLAEAQRSDVVLIGPGCGPSEMLYRLICSLLQCEGAPLVLDADAINVMGAHREEALALLKQAKRSVLLTPHPLEFVRLTGYPLTEIQQCRVRHAAHFAEEYGVSVLLKGTGSVIASPGQISVNTSGSSALAKGGSGDVLAGIAASFLAQGSDAHTALTLAAYLHGKAGESVAKEFSEYGVLPSDLPKRVATELARIVSDKPSEKA